MVAIEGSNRTYPMVGVKEGHHHLSHHQQDKEKIEKTQKMDEYHATHFGYFLEKLKSIRERDGTLLDNSMVLYGTAISDGNRHHHHDLPVLLAGRGGGTIRPGRHMAVSSETPLNDLYLSLLDRVGALVERFG